MPNSPSLRPAFQINALKNQLTVLAQENQSIQTQLLSPGVVGSGGLGGGEDEEETEAIAAAIHNLERLILRNAEEKRTGRSGGGGTTRKGSFFGTRSPKAGGGGKVRVGRGGGLNVRGEERVYCNVRRCSSPPSYYIALKTN